MSNFYESFRDSMHLPATWYNHYNTCDPHFHAGIELVYMFEGQLEAVINGQMMILNENELLVVNSYSVHKFLSPESYTLTSVIPLSAVPSMQKQLTSCRFMENILADDQDRNLAALMKLLAAYPNNEFIQRGACYAILGYLTEHLTLQPISSSDQTDVICGILNYLNDHYTQQLTVEKTCRQNLVTAAAHFSHMFKSTVGYSLPQYLNLLRCRHVAEALISTNRSMVELAIDAGFNNMHTLYSAFRNYYNMTPGQYLNSHKRNRLPNRDDTSIGST